MNLRLFVCLLSLSVMATACSQGALSTTWSSPSSVNSLASEIDGETPLQVLTNSYETQALAILQTNCTSCHTSTTGPTGVYGFDDVSHMLSTGLITAGAPTQSLIYTEVSSGMMPPTGALSTSDQQVLAEWIAGTQAGGASPTPTPVPISTPTTTATFTYIENNIIATSCVSCHSSYSTYAGVTADVVASSPTTSPLYIMVNEGHPEGAPLTADQVADIYFWISNGAPND